MPPRKKPTPAPVPNGTAAVPMSPAQAKAALEPPVPPPAVPVAKPTGPHTPNVSGPTEVVASCNRCGTICKPALSVAVGSVIPLRCKTCGSNTKHTVHPVYPPNGSVPRPVAALPPAVCECPNAPCGLQGKDGIIRCEKCTAPISPPQTTAAAALKPTAVAQPDTTAPKRTVGWRWTNGAFGILAIRDKAGVAFDYLAERISPLYHRLTKLEPGRQTVYTVRLPHPDTDQPPSCSCDAGRKGIQCKHVLALIALQESNQL